MPTFLYTRMELLNLNNIPSAMENVADSLREKARAIRDELNTLDLE